MKKWKAALLQIASIWLAMTSIGVAYELDNNIIAFLVGAIVVACFEIYSWVDKRREP